MRVALVGYGRMGKLIEGILVSRGHEVTSRIDFAGNGDAKAVDAAILAGVDGIIEFALADGIMDRLALYAASGKPVVVGTTGWNDRTDAARSLYEGSAGAILRGSNFSVGAHLFFRLTAAAARLVNSLEEYDAAVVEHHHTGKADYPSGTALTAAEGILAELDRKRHIIADLPDGPIPADALQVASVRVGSVPGVHELQLDSPADYVTIRHEARSRGGFALGAVRGLEWLSGRKGWHEADEFVDDLLTGC